MALNIDKKEIEKQNIIIFRLLFSSLKCIILHYSTLSYPHGHWSLGEKSLPKWPSEGSTIFFCIQISRAFYIDGDRRTAQGSYRIRPWYGDQTFKSTGLNIRALSSHSQEIVRFFEENEEKKYMKKIYFCVLFFLSPLV